MITGAFYVGSKPTHGSGTFVAVDPSTANELEPKFAVATLTHVEEACRLAHDAFDAYRQTSREARATFLETIAERIEGLGDELITRAMAETALPRPRLEGERLRTVTQLRFFADVVRDGSWLGARIEHGLPERTPPRPDLRLRNVPLGPVAVFGASNFPLAFSVAGGDTAAALAAGCPVVVRAHPAHPGVSELIGSAIAGAVADAELPPGVFSMLAGPSHELGRTLVADPHICAVGFTGSRTAGLALCAVAAARAVPIPVFAEMSSVNPIFLLPGALADADALAQAYVGSLTLGAGQFCTNPGLVFAPAGATLERFATAAAQAIESAAAQTMLTAGIHRAYEAALARLERAAGAAAAGQGMPSGGPCQGRAALLRVSWDAFRTNPLFAQEAFGPTSIIIEMPSADSLLDAVATLEGQLTATVHLRERDHGLAARLFGALELRAGRIIANGWPTGVEVSRAMVHGGPFPATSDGRTTSVGALAIERFLRPVCYQDIPADLLPGELADTGSEVPRCVDGSIELPR